jgi:hypothetical protein
LVALEGRIEDISEAEVGSAGVEVELDELKGLEILSESVCVGVGLGDEVIRAVAFSGMFVVETCCGAAILLYISRIATGTSM